MIDEQELQTRFTYHAPRGDQPARYQAIRDQVRVTANVLSKHCPDSRELSLALTKLEEAAFWANAAIARRDPPATTSVG